MRSSYTIILYIYTLKCYINLLQSEYFAISSCLNFYKQAYILQQLLHNRLDVQSVKGIIFIIINFSVNSSPKWYKIGSVLWRNILDIYVTQCLLSQESVPGYEIKVVFKLSFWRPGSDFNCPKRVVFQDRLHCEWTNACGVLILSPI